MTYYARNITPADGVTAAFGISFDYRLAGHVAVYNEVYGDMGTPLVVGADYTFTSSSLITLDAAPVLGNLVRARQTPLSALPVPEFFGSSTITASNLNVNFTALLHMAQERADEQKAISGRSLMVPSDETAPAIPSVPTRAETFFWWDEAGDAVALAPSSAATLLAPALFSTGQLTVTSAAGNSYTTSAAMLAALAPVIGQVVYLAPEDSHFEVIATSGTPVDTYGFLYRTSTADATKTYKRLVKAGEQYRASWAGFGAAAPNTNHLRIQAIHDLVPEGATIRLPDEDFNVNASGDNALTWTKKGLRLTGNRHKTRWHPTHGTTQNPISIAAVGFRVDNFTIYGWETPDNSGARFAIYISDRYAGGRKAAISDGIVEEMDFISLATGVRVMQQPWGSTGISLITTPKRIKLRNNLFDDCAYQAILAGGEDVEIHGNTVNMRVGAYLRPLGYPIRVFGGKGVDIHDNTLYSPEAAACVGIMTVGVDVVDGSVGSTYNRVWDSQDIQVHHNTIYGAVLVNDCASSGRVVHNTFRHPGGLGGAAPARAFVIFASDLNPLHPLKQGKFVMEANIGIGFNGIATMNGPYSNVTIEKNFSVGNAYVGSQDCALFAIQAGSDGHPRNLRIVGNECYGLTGNYLYGIRVQGVAGGNYVILDNVVPEGLSNIVVGDGGSVGKVLTDFATGFVNWGSQTAGRNVAAPAGSFAAAKAGAEGSSSPRLTF